jgi:hypothetical protein
VLSIGLAHLFLERDMHVVGARQSDTVCDIWKQGTTDICLFSRTNPVYKHATSILFTLYCSLLFPILHWAAKLRGSFERQRFLLKRPMEGSFWEATRVEYRARVMSGRELSPGERRQFPRPRLRRAVLPQRTMFDSTK